MGKSISKIKVLFLSFFLFPISAYSNDFRHYNEWTKEEKIEFITFTAVAYADYRMTEWALEQRNPNGTYVYYEANPFLGRRPNDTKLMAYQLVSIACYYYLVGYHYDSPKTQKTIEKIRYFAMGARIGVLVHNDSIGIQFSKAF